MFGKIVNLGPLLSNDVSSSGDTAVSPFADWSALINLMISANTIWRDKGGKEM